MSAKRLVVVVEDDAASAEALALILSDWGAEAVVGARPDAILTQLGPRATEVGWIITDFNLGDGLTGLDAAQALTAAAPDARVLVLTGSFAGRADARAATAGLKVMFKPARAEAIVAWLESE